MLTLIATYRRELAFFDCHAPEDDDERDLLAKNTFKRPLRTLERWGKPATSMAEAIEALRLADRAMHDGEDRMAASMVTAALGFFELKG
ncbi:hypothetical protein [Ensifer sp. BR816]|uniref:hypothetical protein n=1 Tax=Rhizobium sp. (strain BR816) TaxID=1057002 RepID=UPI000382923F|nr:hypothetical protein [Ensifer sp. BR816]